MQNQESRINLNDDGANYPNQKWLTEERDACGVGFIADSKGRASHKLIAQSLIALGCLEHRGGCSADRDSGDGSGVLTAIPRLLFQSWFAENNLPMPPEGQLGVGMVFLPQDGEEAGTSRAYIEQIVTQEGLTILGWRAVPIKPEILGTQAKENQPVLSKS